MPDPHCQGSRPDKQQELRCEPQATSNCCAEDSISANNRSSANNSGPNSCCDTPKGRPDWLLWGSLGAILLLYLQHWWLPETTHFASWYATLSHSVFELINRVWWGILLGIFMLCLLSRIPREFIMSALGTNTGFKGIVRATSAGVLLDLCSHGILMVAAKLYERGASNGQTMAFLIASPWNSFSLTLILFALIGWQWTLLFILLSMLIALCTGWLFDKLTARGHLPANPQQCDLPENFHFRSEAKKQLAKVSLSPALLRTMLLDGIRDSRMVLRWLFFGVLLASLIRALIDVEVFSTFFGPTVLGLFTTLLAATIIEVCSEGSTPIAADLLTRANAPGNSFTFLMAGVSTDYTEIMVLRETTRSWKITLFLPLLTLPQILLLGAILNLSVS